MHKVEFKNSRGLTLRGVVHAPKSYDTAFIALHGFPGDMNGGPKRLCNALSKRGFLCLRFSFSGTPPSEGKFEDKLMSREVRDIKAAVDYLHRNFRFKRLVLMGGSTGAIDAALYAHTDRRISKLIIAGAVSHLDQAARYDFTDRQVREFWRKGSIVYHRPGHWVHRRRLNKAFYDEFFTLDIPKAIRRYHRPLLIVHGTEDEAVPVKNDPHELYRLANRPKKLVIVKGANHRFTNPRHFRRLVREVVRFIG